MIPWLLALIPLSLAAYFIHALLHVGAGAVVGSMPWAPGLDIHLSVYMDGWSLLMASLISGIGFLVVLYAGSYLKGHPQLGRFYLYLLIFMTSMLGVVISDNMIALFVFWELTSLSSYFLIGFDHEKAESRANALQALLVTGAGGLCLLAGFLLVGQIAGSYRISEATLNGAAIVAHPLGGLALGMILVGAFTKSAQFPFHFWLPNAMAAPAPVSAYLHSSTMVKAGIYVLARFFEIFGQTETWRFVLPLVGLLTVFAGVRMSFREKDMKRQLAYMTVTALGILVLLLGMGTPAAIQAAMVFLLAHALYKGALFMVVGAVDHEVHCREAEKLGGLARRMPILAGAALLAGLSMAGVPPLFGFIAKEVLFESVLHSAWLWAAGAGVSAAGAAFVVYFLLISVRPFWGGLSAAAGKAHEPPFGLWFGPVVLASLGFIFGLFPFLADGALKSACSSVFSEPRYPKLALWHGVNAALAWSLCVLAAGAGLYLKLNAVRALVRNLEWLRPGPETLYSKLLSGLNHTAVFLTRSLQTGRLRDYLRVTILSTFLLCGLTLLKGGWMPVRMDSFGFIEAALVVLMIASSLAAVLTQGRLTAVAFLGVVGLSITLIFLNFGAPDLAMTQFTVDMLTVILLALVLHRMPPAREKAPSEVAWMDLAVSVAAGGVIFLLTLFAASGVDLTKLPPSSEFFTQNSLAAAHGRNIVNVILVDFRAIDTMGEITVLIISGLGCYSLVRLVRGSGGKRS